jgi:hypothetical protein
MSVVRIDCAWLGAGATLLGLPEMCPSAGRRPFRGTDA